MKEPRPIANTRGVICEGARQQEAAAVIVATDENSARLKSCAGPHGFVREGQVTEGGRIGEPTGLMRCIRCRGTVTEDQARWYKRGLAHGRENP